ncbi:hypothetical protein D3C75_989000 [compost metagenome]
MRAMAIDLPVSREYMPQVITPTCLPSAHRVSPPAAACSPSSSTPKILKRSLPLSRACSRPPRNSALVGDTVKSRPSSQRVSPAA